MTAVSSFEPRSTRARTATAVALAAALATVVAWQGLAWRQAIDDDRQRARVVSIAEAQVIDLLSMTGSNVSQKLRVMSKRTTGTFKRELDGIAAPFNSTFAGGKLRVEGKIAASAVERMDSRRARVLVASDARVYEGKKRTPTLRSYRLRVSLARHGSGWLIDDMEFVR